MCNAADHFVANDIVDDGDSCICEAAAHFVEDLSGDCICDSDAHYEEVADECICLAAEEFVSDGNNYTDFQLPVLY